MAFAYTTVSDAKIQAGIPSADTSLDDWINALIGPVSEAINAYCNRWFAPRTMTIPWDFQDPWKLKLWSLDLISVTQIMNGNGTVLPSSAYLLYPIIGPPYRWIEIKRNNGIVFAWSGTPQQAISITGSWGYVDKDDLVSTPAPIKYAAAAWISYLLQMGPAAGIKSKSIGDYSVGYGLLSQELKDPPGEVMHVLKSYIRRDYQATAGPEIRDTADILKLLQGG